MTKLTLQERGCKGTLLEAYTDTDILVMAWQENHRDGDYPTDQICAGLKANSVDIDNSLSRLEMMGVLAPCGGRIQEINIARFFAELLAYEMKTRKPKKKSSGGIGEILWKEFWGKDLSLEKDLYFVERVNLSTNRISGQKLPVMLSDCITGFF